MRAAVVAAPGQVQVLEVPLPAPGEGEVCVRLQGCGVCASNLSPWKGEPWFSYPMEPGQLGHEGWGTIESLGPNVEGFEAGQRVAMLSGHAYAEYDVAPTNSLVALPRELDGRDFPGEPLGCALNIWERSKNFGGLSAGDTVAIVGAGFLGALLTRLAANDGARVIAISRRPYSLDVARHMGAHEVIEMGEQWQVIDHVKRLTDDRLCDIVIEAVGKQEPLDLAGALCRERGRLVIAGYHQDGLRTVNMQEWNWRGLDVINAHEREHQKYIDGIAAAAQAVASEKLDPSSLYTHRFPLEKLGEALDATRDRPHGFLKALIEF
jgi:threonine dehydrogenase-like Zn-dependent dehydrogenase